MLALNDKLFSNKKHITKTFAFEFQSILYRHLPNFSEYFLNSYSTYEEMTTEWR